MKNILIIGVVTAAIIAQVRAAEPKESALDAAKRYTAVMKSDQPIKAVETFWEFPEIFQTMFGEHLKQHTAAQREEMKKLFLGFLRKVYANPQIAEMMKNATFSDFQEKPPKDGKTVVTFNVRSGDHNLPNALVFKQIEGKWRVVDAAANKGPLLGEAIAREYSKQSGQITPLEYVTELARGAP